MALRTNDLELNSNQKTVTDFVFPRSHGFAGTDLLVSFETSSTGVPCIGGEMEQYLL